jgi:hypothetical protein
MMKQFQSTTRPKTFKWELDGQLVAYQGFAPFNDEWLEMEPQHNLGAPHAHGSRALYLSYIGRGDSPTDAKDKSGYTK